MLIIQIPLVLSGNAVAFKRGWRDYSIRCLFVERVITHLHPDNIDEMLRGYYLERKVINEYEQAELISSRYAKQLRKEVNTLEDYLQRN